MPDAKMPITPELLVAMLHLPPGTTISDATFDPAERIVILTVNHDAITKPTVHPEYRNSGRRVTFVGWGV